MKKFQTIDSFFPKKAAPSTSQPITPKKRKALQISSDEEEGPPKQVSAAKAKSNKHSNEQANSNKKVKRNDADKHHQPVNVLSMFGGEPAREDKSRSKTPHKEAKNEENRIVDVPKQKTPKKNKIPSESLRRSPRIAKTTLITPEAEKKTVHSQKEETTSGGKKSLRNTETTKSEELDVSNKTSIGKTDSLGKNSIKRQHEHEYLPHDQCSSSNKSIQLKTKYDSIKKSLKGLLNYDEHQGAKGIKSDTGSTTGNQKLNMGDVLQKNLGYAGSRKIKANKLGYSFLLAGDFNSIEQDKVLTTIKELGGKVMDSANENFNYIIIGENADPKTLESAKSPDVKMLTIKGFFDLFMENSQITTKMETDGKIKQTSSQVRQSCKEENILLKTKDVECRISKLSVQNGEPKMKLKQEINASITETKQNPKDENNMTWVDKYKPTTVKQIVGQQGAASNCVKLTNWLSKWHTNQKGNKKIQKPSPWAKNDDGSYFKAALLSGPPGVGKTTTASLVCKELGFDAVEFNASDTRSKRHLKEEVAELLSNKSLHGYFHGSAEVVSKKHVLIMDEVDGMAGNEDRGGIQELIDLIKGSHVPIICMCNDRNLQKMRSLVNYCYDLRFNRPRLEQIKGFVKSICFKERVNLSTEKIEEIILATNNDIRQSVNHLCLLSAGKDIMSKPGNGQTAHKDLKMGPWDVVRKVFSESEHKNMSLQDKTDLFFHDYSMAPLFVQQNYLMVSPSAPKSELLRKIALTADALSLGDLVDRRIRSNSAWVLLPVQAVFSSFLPGEYMAGHFTGQINFPSWLGKFSKANKRKRLAQEIHDHTRLRTSGSRLSIRLDYAPFLLSKIVRPLREKGLEGVSECLNVLQEYRLLREDIESLIDLTIWPGKKSQMDAVEGRVKAALTRAYNKDVLPYSYSATTAIKKKKYENADVDDLLEITDYEEGETAEIESEEENEDILENDTLIKAKKKITSSKTPASKPSANKKTSLSVKQKAVAKNKSK